MTVGATPVGGPRSSSRGLRHLFTYYAVASTDADQVRAEVAAAQVGLEREVPGLQARLLQRELARDDVTFMEIYSVDIGIRPAGIDHVLQQHLESRLRQVLGSRAAGGRHTEVFLECAWSQSPSTTTADSR